MITQFDTSTSTPKSGGKGNSMLLLVGVLVGGFLLYKFVIKPKMDKSNEETD
jgi:LPXTG-motif cell wall-anchored protein